MIIMATNTIASCKAPELSMTPDDAAMIDHLPAEAATALARSLQRLERQVIARKVLSAARIGQSVFLDMLTSGHEIKLPHRRRRRQSRHQQDIDCPWGIGRQGESVDGTELGAVDAPDGDRSVPRR
ncbi:hypothetical protein ABLE92_13925 [Gordonia sp. VNQ95]